MGKNGKIFHCSEEIFTKKKKFGRIDSSGVKTALYVLSFLYTLQKRCRKLHRAVSLWKVIRNFGKKFMKKSIYVSVVSQSN